MDQFCSINISVNDSVSHEIDRMATSTVYLLIVTVFAQGILGQLDLPPKDPVDEVPEVRGVFGFHGFSN